MAKLGYVKIFGYDFTFVFRHRYEKPDEERLVDKFTMWRDWKIGLWFKRNKIVGKKNFSQPKEWKDNLIREYMVGIDLLILKAWFTVSRGAMKIKTDE